MGVLSGGHGAALRRLDDLTSDVSAVKRAMKHAEVESVTKLDLQAHVRQKRHEASYGTVIIRAVRLRPKHLTPWTDHLQIPTLPF